MSRQLPEHDQDPSKCHELSPPEVKQMQQYVRKYKDEALGVGDVLLPEEMALVRAGGQGMAGGVGTGGAQGAGGGAGSGPGVGVAGAGVSTGPGVGSTARPAVSAGYGPGSGTGGAGTGMSAAGAPAGGALGTTSTAGAMGMTGAQQPGLPQQNYVSSFTVFIPTSVPVLQHLSGSHISHSILKAVHSSVGQLLYKHGMFILYRQKKMLIGINTDHYSE